MGRMIFARGVALFVAVSAMGLGACSSDEFGRVGGDLPLDVSQDPDSLRVVLPSVAVLEAMDVVPDLDQDDSEREILYLGHRDLGGFRATPMLRFHLDRSSLPDSVVIDSTNLRRIELELEPLATSVAKGFARTVGVYRLQAPLDSTANEQPLGSLLGEELFETQGLLATDPILFHEESTSPQAVSRPALRDSVLSWIERGADFSVALFDVEAVRDSSTGPTENNFIGFAANEFRLFGSLLLQNSAAETATPELKLSYTNADNEEAFLSFVPEIDLTHFESDPPPGEDLVLGAFQPSRIWMRFDLGDSVVPGDATVNRARLRLHLRPDNTLSEGLQSLDAYESPVTQAAVASVGELDRILGSAAGIDIADTLTLTVDLTDFVQRAVNLVVDPTEVGVLLALDDETLLLDVLDFYGVDAPADSLQPQLEITFTPPADFWR